MNTETEKPQSLTVHYCKAKQRNGDFLLCFLKQYLKKLKERVNAINNKSMA